MQQRRSLGAPREHRQIRLAIFPQEAGRPIERPVERAPVILGGAFVQSDIGAQRIAGRGEQGFKLLFDRRCSGFELVEPREMMAVEILVGRKKRIADPGALILESPAAAQGNIGKGADAALFRLIAGRAILGNGSIGGNANPGFQRSAIGLAQRQLLRQRFRHLG